MIQTLKQYFLLSTPKVKTIIILLATALFTHVPYMVTPLIYSKFIKHLTQKDLTLMIPLITTYFILKIISKIAAIANSKMQQKYFWEVYINLQNKLVEKVEILDLSYFGANNKSNFINIANHDIKELANFSTWLTNTLMLIISFIISIIILATINIYLMLFAICINSFVVSILNIYNKKYEKIVYEMRSDADIETSFFTQILQSVNEIKIFSIMRKLHNNYKKLNIKYCTRNNERINNDIKKNILTPTITMVAEMLLIMYSVYAVFYGEFGIDAVLMINSYFGTMFSNLTQLITALGALRVINVSINRYQQIMNQTHTINYGILPFKVKTGAIDFKNITVTYEGISILDNISFSIIPNSITALIGQSGSGKSTIANLLMNFIKKDAGNILIDGVDMSTVLHVGYQDNIVMVQQESFFFQMSIYQNLALINNDRKAIIEACKRVQLHDFIESLPLGYNTILEDNASNLSGGQKQRLAIARALLSNAKILIFDEITSALDQALSKNIFTLLNKLKESHTIILISHKPKEYQQCDVIYEVKQKKVYLKKQMS